MTDTVPLATEYEPEAIDADADGDELTVPSPAEPSEAAVDPAI